MQRGGRHADPVGGDPVKRRMNAILTGLALVRIGQELGSDTAAARAIHDLLELLGALPWKFFG